MTDYIGNYKNRPRRVVFYGRVSTEHEEQLSALGNQMEWYKCRRLTAKFHTGTAS